MNRHLAAMSKTVKQHREETSMLDEITQSLIAESNILCTEITLPQNPRWARFTGPVSYQAGASPAFVTSLHHATFAREAVPNRTEVDM